MAVAFAVVGMLASETFGTTSPVTGTAPSATDGTDGQYVHNLDALSLFVSCPSGGTFSGAGSFDCYARQSSVNGGRWSRYKTGDFSAAECSGKRDYLFESCDLFARASGAQFRWVPTGVDFAGGGSTGVVCAQLGSPQAEGNRKVFGA